VWVGHSCPTLLVLVLISTAAEAGAFTPEAADKSALHTNLTSAADGTAFGEKEGHSVRRGEGRGPSTAKCLHCVKAFLRSG
jgi:hypothetical protein